MCVCVCVCVCVHDAGAWLDKIFTRATEQAYIKSGETAGK